MFRQLLKLFQFCACLMLLMALCILPATAQTSAPIQAPAAVGGHWYEVILTNGTMSWSQARDAAYAKGGYLVSITSPDENSFVLNQLPLPGVGAFMGGFEASPGNWTWLSAESWALYNNWNAGEPNFVTPPEREVATEFYTNNSVSPRLPGYWNNIAPSHVSTEFASYIVEYNADPAKTGGLPEGFENSNWKQSWTVWYGNQDRISDQKHSGNYAVRMYGNGSACGSSMYPTDFRGCYGTYSTWFRQEWSAAEPRIYVMVDPANTTVDPVYRESYMVSFSAADAAIRTVRVFRVTGPGTGTLLKEEASLFHMNEWVRGWIKVEAGGKLTVGYVWQDGLGLTLA